MSENKLPVETCITVPELAASDWLPKVAKYQVLDAGHEYALADLVTTAHVVPLVLYKLVAVPA
jgi:hypothetical protein